MFNNDFIKSITGESFIPSPKIVILCITIFVLSFLAFLFHPINTILFITILCIVALGTYLKLEFGVLAILIELFLGGHGYLFSISILNYVVSLRIALFVVVALIWIFYHLRNRSRPILFSLPFKWVYILLLLSVLTGIIVGILHGNGKLVFYDANAYIALLYIPIFLDAVHSTFQKKRLLVFATSAAFSLACVTILFLGIYMVFHYDASLKSAITLNDELYKKLEAQILEGNVRLGQSTSIQAAETQLNPLELTKTKPATYRWLLDTGTAEISYVSGRFFRVFFPSQIFILISFLSTVSFLTFSTLRKELQRILFIVSGILLVALIIGYSRSYWLGLLIGIIFIGIRAFFQSKDKKKFIRRMIILCLLCFLALSLTRSWNIIESRFQSVFSPQHDVASAHRIQLAKGIWNEWKTNPIIGSGYGTVIIFPTIFASGEILPTAFYIYEWAYFDIAVKTGILGLIIWLTFFWILGKKLWQNQSAHTPLFAGLFSASIALFVANITTPVFTHPLGLGALAFLSLFAWYDQPTNPNRNLE